jgi:16S rRNA (uracil1498-N3)-methyltransferase
VRRRFFVQEFANGKATLVGDAAHHLGRVLRAEVGQLYELSDGRAVNLARVERVDRDAVEFTVVEPIAVRTARLDVTLLLAVVKFDRMEWALEKATELGAAVIVPLAAARSDKGLLTAVPKRAERWRKILLESAQQARCLWPPQLGELATPREAFRAATGAARILLSERSGAPGMLAVLSDAFAPGSCEKRSLEHPAKLTLAIGPEGGWTDEEFAAASAAGFKESAIGENILRTETAVVAALAAAQLFCEQRA